jgi:hypothetical protein
MTTTVNAHCSVLDREDAILSLIPFEGSVPVVVELVDLSFEEVFGEDVLLFERREQPLVWMFVRVARGRFADAVAQFEKDYSVIGYEAVRESEDEGESIPPF